MLDFGHYAETQLGADDFAGLSGGPLRSTAETGLGTGRHPKPLWFINVLTSATRAEETGVEYVDDVPCRRFDVRLDLRDAALLGPAESPSLNWPDPTAVPLVVWLEGSLLRRIRYQETAPVTETLTFQDLGVNLSGLDWERMGTFRTPNPQVASPNAV
jgi:hypothetical protein